METENQQDPQKLPGTIKWISEKKFLRIEIILVILSVTSFVLGLSGIQTDTIFVLSMGTLAVLYFIRAQILAKNLARLKRFALNVTGVSTAASIVGLLFKFQNYEGGDIQLRFGMYGLALSFMILLYLRMVKRFTDMDEHLIRCSILLIISLVFVYFY